MPEAPPHLQCIRMHWTWGVASALWAPRSSVGLAVYVHHVLVCCLVGRADWPSMPRASLTRPGLLTCITIRTYNRNKETESEISNFMCVLSGSIMTYCLSYTYDTCFVHSDYFLCIPLPGPPRVSHRGMHWGGKRKGGRNAQEGMDAS